jgi:hypothetical protein
MDQYPRRISNEGWASFLNEKIVIIRMIYLGNPEVLKSFPLLSPINLHTPFDIVIQLFLFAKTYNFVVSI